jgi:phosphatidylserine/phosphatidylglycerophosphate/cardiolipin synthase-like enzyme
VRTERSPASSVRVLLTASEAYPALERAFLAAETEVRASFLVFDPATPLRSDEARKVGSTWFDLIVQTLARGVALHFVLSDVDPIGRAAMHRAAVRSQRMFLAAAEVAGPGARLSVRLARHPAQTGFAIRLAIWPYIQSKVHATAGWLNGLDPASRAAALRDMPGAARNLRLRPDGTVKPRLWSIPQLSPVTHHQKLAVVDRRLLYIGGLDLDERRYDTPEHRRAADQTWHDVQLMMEGPVVAEAQTHLERFLAVTDGLQEPSPTRRLLRTLSRQRKLNAWHFGPERVVSDLRIAHTALARRAERLIYLETQYFRDRGFARELADLARRNADLAMILILPAAPDEVAFDGRSGLDARYGEFMQASALRIIRQAFGARLFVGSPAQRKRAPWVPVDDVDEPPRDRLHDAPLVYVHAKVSVFDDQAAIISSANLNGRSFYWDTEAGVFLNNRNDVADLRQRVMAHWLPAGAGPEAFAIATAAPVWARLARANARKRPEDRDGFLLPHDFAAAEVFGRRLPVVPEEMV